MNWYSRKLGLGSKVQDGFKKAHTGWGEGVQKKRKKHIPNKDKLGGSYYKLVIYLKAQMKTE